ncbi:MAG: CHASE3 domain-containing protein [Candidatus Obscuribacterales bacterium]|nr:CHASE3 domain-containing protein [Candidatus Obscuribacterales bacterium]
MDKKLVLWVVSSIVPIITVGFISYEQTATALDSKARGEQEFTVKSELKEVLGLVRDAETGTRGYVITGKEDYLEPYIKAIAKIETHLRALHDLVRDDPEMAGDMAKLEPIIADKLERLEANIVTRRKDGFAAAAERIKTGKGRIMMDEIRTLIDEMESKDLEHSKLTTAAKSSTNGYGTEGLLRTAGVLAIFMLLLAGCNIAWSRVK